jgi:predicted metal-dependent phosphoesterase TrpH
MDAERIDLHTHSHHSDGVLSPTQLVELAGQRALRLLALTDHDTTAGCAEAASACEPLGIHFLPGVELTTQWRGREIHVVGLNVDPAEVRFVEHLRDMAARRRRRLGEMCARLSRAGLDGPALEQAIGTTKRVPTRTDLARELVRVGHADTLGAAFDKWLLQGRPGYVVSEWPELGISVARIREAGGEAVLAHPHCYKFSNGVLQELCTVFRDAGGTGIEVSIAGMSPNDASRMATIARRTGLAGSIGSDFHEPGQPWRPLGRFAKLPEGIMPMTERIGWRA